MLDLKLNNLDDQCGTRIFKDLCSNSGLLKLDISSKFIMNIHI